MKRDLSGTVSRCILIAAGLSIAGCFAYNDVQSTKEVWKAKNMSTWRKIWTTSRIWYRPSHAMTTPAKRTMKQTLTAAQPSPDQAGVHVMMTDTSMRLAQIKRMRGIS